MHARCATISATVSAFGEHVDGRAPPPRTTAPRRRTESDIHTESISTKTIIAQQLVIVRCGGGGRERGGALATGQMQAQARSFVGKATAPGGDRLCSIALLHNRYLDTYVPIPTLVLHAYLREVCASLSGERPAGSSSEGSV